MDFRELMSQAEEALGVQKEALEAAIKKAKEAELSFLDKKAELKDREASVKAKEKEVDAKLSKLSRLEAVEADLQNQAERELRIEELERKAKKMMDDAATMQLQAEQALQSAKEVKDKANREKAEVEGKILEKFKKIVMEA